MKEYVLTAMFIALTFGIMNCNNSAIAPKSQFLKLHFRCGFGNELNSFLDELVNLIIGDIESKLADKALPMARGDGFSGHSIR